MKEKSSRKSSELVKTIAEVAVFSALGYVLDFLAGTYSSPLFVNGGSIGIAMACVFFVSFRRGLLPGILTGLIMGLLDIADGFYSIADVWYKAFAQVALDYWIAYPLAGFAGVFYSMFHKATDAKHKVLAVVYGVLLGGGLKLLSHYLSGILFWPGDPWNVGGSYVYSLLYNGAYMLPDMILSGAVIIFFAAKFPQLFETKVGVTVKEEDDENNTESLSEF